MPASSRGLLLMLGQPSPLSWILHADCPSGLGTRSRWGDQPSGLPGRRMFPGCGLSKCQDLESAGQTGTSLSMPRGPVRGTAHCPNPGASRMEWSLPCPVSLHSRLRLAVMTSPPLEPSVPYRADFWLHGISQTPSRLLSCLKVAQMVQRLTSQMACACSY